MYKEMRVYRCDNILYVLIVKISDDYDDIRTKILRFSYYTNNNITVDDCPTGYNDLVSFLDSKYNRIC